MTRHAFSSGQKVGVGKVAEHDKTAWLLLAGCGLLASLSALLLSAKGGRSDGVQD